MNSSLSLALLQQIIDQLPANIFCRDTNGRYLFANKVFAREAGLQHPDEVIGKCDAEMPWGMCSARRTIACWPRASPCCISNSIATTVPPPAGWRSTRSPSMTDRARPIALFAMISAIDQRKELEQTYRQQQLLQRRLLDAIPDLIRLEDHQGVLIDCNQAFLDFSWARRQRGPGSAYRPPSARRTDPGAGEYCVVDAQVRAATWRSPGSRCRTTRATPSASLTLSRDITGLRTTQAPAAAGAALRQP